MTKWGKRKDGQAYQKDGKGHGIDSGFHEDVKEEVVKVKPIGISDINVTFDEIDRVPVYRDEDSKSGIIGYATKYHCVVSFNGKSESFEYTNSIADTSEGKEPDPKDLLYCLVMDSFAPDNFEDFASEYGYNEDSRKHEAIFKLVQEQNEKIRKLFSEEQIQKIDEELREHGY